MRRPTLLALLCAAVALCTWPALTGTPLLDDVRLVPFNRPPPVASVFAQPVRWQPAVHLSFRAVAALSPRHPFTVGMPLHHLVSFGLHILAVALLLRLARRRHPGERIHPWHALALAAFALHPSLVEPAAYLTARGEVIALASLAAVALAVESDRAVAAVAFTLLGMSASPVVAPAAVALAVAAALDRPSAPARRTTAAAVTLAAVVTLVATFGAHPTAATLARWASRTPHAVGLAVRALLVPTETALRLPQWELTRPLSAVDAACALLPLLVAAVFCVRRSYANAVLVLGATLSILPIVLRADTLAYGFDRYLTGAAVLLAVALLRAPPPAWIAALSQPTRRLVGWSSLALLALLVFMARQTGSGFASDAHELDAMTQMRPRDPSGHLRNAWFAASSGDPITARHSLLVARRLPLTPLMDRAARYLASAIERRY